MCASVCDVCQGIASVVSYVHKKQRHPRVIWVNLRDDVTVQCDQATYSVRDTAALDEPVLLPAATRNDIEVTALGRKQERRSWGWRQDPLKICRRGQCMF